MRSYQTRSRSWGFCVAIAILSGSGHWGPAIALAALYIIGDW